MRHSTINLTLVGSYCDIFTSGIKFKWDQLVYIDLFAGEYGTTISNLQLVNFFLLFA
jgi:hypothetical protein